MPTHAEKRDIPFSPRQLFDLVADIEKYPEFLPWCIATRITSREGDVLSADVVIGYKMVRERFTSKDVLSAPKGEHESGRIDVTYLEGPFKYLSNHWVFEPDGRGGTILDFFIDFEFHSKLTQKLFGPLFHEAVERMVQAFEDRAKTLYGESP